MTEEYSICLWNSGLGSELESDQTNDCKIGIHKFSAWPSALKWQCGKQANKFTRCAVGKAAERDSLSWGDKQEVGNF